jgi:hypothetical protein
MMDEDGASPVESGSSSIPDMNDSPDTYDTPTTDLGDTPTNDMDVDTPIPDLNG